MGRGERCRKTYSNSDILVHASFEGVGIAVEEGLAFRLSDGCADGIAVASSLARVPVANGFHALVICQSFQEYMRVCQSNVQQRQCRNWP